MKIFILLMFFITNLFSSSSDFNNDGIPDILWRKGNINHIWLMNIDGTHTYLNIGKKSERYKVVAIDDFNGDTINDILWRNGDVNHIWYMNKDGSHKYKNIGSKPINYEVVGSGDFNGDGIADVLWRKGYSNYIWYMNIDGSHIYKKIDNKSYKVMSVKDFNNDGIADILWRKNQVNHIWYMNKDGSHIYKNIGNKSTDYILSAVADFNNDKIPDILWRKGSNNYIWYMNKDGTHKYKKISTKSIKYRLLKVADFNNDSISDILWRKGDDNHLWIMDSDGNHSYINIGKKSIEYEMYSDIINRDLIAKTKVEVMDNINSINDVVLKKKLLSCKDKAIKRTNFAVGHRGMRLKYPEHTKESYIAAAKSGAGIVECDVTFTKDEQLVCRHSQCDLHRTTNILLFPDLMDKCQEPFSPAEFDSNGKLVKKATARCCTSDISLKDFKRLTGKIDSYNKYARTKKEYMKVDKSLYSNMFVKTGTLMTHKESILLISSLGASMTPEIKEPKVKMPFNGSFSQHDFIDKIISDYEELNINPNKVYIQSKNIEDLKYIVDNYSEFAKNLMFSDQSMFGSDKNATPPLLENDGMKKLKSMGINYLGAPIWMLLKLDSNNSIVPSDYAIKAKNEDLTIIAYTFNTPKSIKYAKKGGDWYYQSLKKVINNKGDYLKILNILINDINISNIYTDFAPTVVYFDNCLRN